MLKQAQEVSAKGRSLEDYQAVMERCARCSYCKFIPQAHIKSRRFAKGCPSIARYNFHSYSASGRLAASLSLLQGRSGFSDRLLDIAYKCQMCGSCDVACKVCRYDMQPLETIHELRFRLVEEGQTLPEHMPLIEGLRKDDNMMQKPKADRGKWAEGLAVKDLTKERAEVVFHAGCRLSYDEELQKIARTTIRLLTNAGIDVGILGKDETCCGTRAYDMGYRGEFTKYAENNIEVWKNAGAKTVVVCCADGYYGIKRLYPRLGARFEVLHVSEVIGRLLAQGRLKFSKKVPLKVTYHDPCHLGRLGENYIEWDGVEKKVRNQINIHVPRMTMNRGARGVYEPPRNILRSIPGLAFTEMERVREFSWCCGAGGACYEAYPEFAGWTALERLEEARATGAEAMVTACPWCERNFIDALRAKGGKMPVYDIVELVAQSL